MSFASPLGLLALLAVPLVLALHLFRRRLAHRRVAGLFLYAPDRLIADAGRKRTRLMRTASLWLELAAVVALALWLGEPVIDAGGAAPHLVFVLDDSASMSARAPDGSSGAERARRAVEDLLERTSRDARVTVVFTGTRPQVSCGPRASAAAARAALGGWQPSRPAHDPRRALELALELGGEECTPTFVTDGDDVEVPGDWHVIAVGREAPNAGLLHVRRIALGAPGDGQVLCDVGLWADRSGRAEVAVESDGRVLASRDVELSPSGPTRVAFDVRGAPGDWTVRVSMEGDALALDDRRVSLPDPRRVVGLGVTMEGEKAARLQLDRVVRAVDGLARHEDGPRAPLRVTGSREAMAPRPGQVELVVAPCGADLDAWIGPYWVERPHPVTDGLTLDGVVWAAGRERPPGVPLVTAGSATLASFERFANDAVRVHLNLEPARTNLTTSPDWPILLQNLAEVARERLPGPLEAHVAVGDELRWRPSPEDRAALDEVQLIGPGGEVQEGRGARLVGFEARRPGVHRLMARGEEVARFSAFFVDPQESDLRTRFEFDRPAEPVVGAGDDDARSSDGADEARWLALAVLIAVLADWWVLRRGVAP